MKRRLFVFGFVIVCCTLMTFGGAKVSAKTVKFDKSNITIVKNKTKKIKLKNVKKKIKWKVTNKKIVKIISKKGKYNNTIVIKAKKAGKTVIIAKAVKKKYKLKVKVINKSQSKTDKPTTSTDDTKKQQVTPSENSTDNKTVSVECKVDYKDSAINVNLTNNIDDTITTGYTSFKLYKKNGSEWVEGIPEGLTFALIEIACILEKGDQLNFSIPFYRETEGGEYEKVENPLGAGQYKYVHSYYTSKDGQKTVESFFEVN